MQKSTDSELEKGIMDSSERAKDSVKSPDESDGALLGEIEQAPQSDNETDVSKEDFEEKSEHESLMDIHLTPSESSDDDLPDSDKAILESAVLPEDDIPTDPMAGIPEKVESQEPVPKGETKQSPPGISEPSADQVFEHSIDISDAGFQQTHTVTITETEFSTPGIDIDSADYLERNDTLPAQTSGGLGAPEIAIQAASPLNQSPSSDDMYIPKAFSGVVVDEFEKEQAEETVVEAAHILEAEAQMEQEPGDAAPLADEPEDVVVGEESLPIHKKLTITASLEAHRDSEPTSDVDSGADIMIESADVMVDSVGDARDLMVESTSSLGRPLSPTDYVLEASDAGSLMEPEGRIEADTSHQIFIEQSIQKTRSPSGGTPAEERPPSPSDYMLVVDQSEGSSIKDGVFPEDGYQPPELEEDKPDEQPTDVAQDVDDQVTSPTHPYEPSPPLGLPHPSAEAFPSGS